MTGGTAERARPAIDVRTARALMRRILRGQATLAPLARGSSAFADYAIAFATNGEAGVVPELSAPLEASAQLYRSALERAGFDPNSILASEPAQRPFAPLAAFACAALDYAAEPGDRTATVLLDSIYSGIAQADARAFVTVAGDRKTVLDTLTSGAVPLDFDPRAAVQRFVSALDASVRALRAQGAGARELVETIVLGFDLESRASAREHCTLSELRACADAVDAARRCTVEAWEPSEIITLLDDAFEAVPETPASSAALPPMQALRPLARYEPEPSRAVARSRSHFSASSLNTFAECERKWFYRYVCAAVEDRGSAASFYGTAFHNALEAFHAEFPRGDTVPPQTLASKLDAQLGSAFERVRLRFETEVEFALQVRRARRTGRRYLEWFVARSRNRPFSIVGEETSADLELEGFSFVGFIDRLDRDDATGGVTVIDYKTGSIATSAAEYRRHIAGLTEFQLPYYYWAASAAGNQVVRLTLIPLKDPLLPVRPVELEVVPVAAAAGRDDALVGTIGIDELERARTRMIELARTLSDALPEHFAVARDPDACTYCSYRAACRERPRRSENRFAR